MDQKNYDKIWVWFWGNSRSILFGAIWGGISIVVLSSLLWLLLQSDDKRLFLPGKTSLGHHQFEIQCEQCHDSFASVSQKACYKCHQQAWQQEDTHAPELWQKPKFQAQRAIIDASQCNSCHREHRGLENTVKGATIASNFCQDCHQTILTKANHQHFDETSCLSCHQYHQDGAMQIDFLKPHQAEKDTFDQASLPKCNFMDFYIDEVKHKIKPLTMKQHDAPESSNFNLARDWEDSSHAKAGINCRACHDQVVDDQKQWLDKPPPNLCKDCHQLELDGFLASSHGIRIQMGLPAMHTGLSDLPMKSLVNQRHLSCVACHKAHPFDRVKAAVEACLGCHNDQHSQAYKMSEHYKLWQQALTGEVSKEQGVSCATCHMPRQHHGNRILVQHNVSENFRSKKMMVKVCMDCHGLGFSIDSLKLEKIKKNNFQGKPKPEIMDMVK